jgi:hypothetical protein
LQKQVAQHPDATLPNWGPPSSGPPPPWICGWPGWA